MVRSDSRSESELDSADLVCKTLNLQPQSNGLNCWQIRKNGPDMNKPAPAPWDAKKKEADRGEITAARVSVLAYF